MVFVGLTTWIMKGGPGSQGEEGEILQSPCNLTTHNFFLLQARTAMGLERSAHNFLIGSPSGPTVYSVATTSDQLRQPWRRTPPYFSSR